MFFKFSYHTIDGLLYLVSSTAMVVLSQFVSVAPAVFPFGLQGSQLAVQFSPLLLSITHTCPLSDPTLVHRHSPVFPSSVIVSGISVSVSAACLFPLVVS